MRVDLVGVFPPPFGGISVHLERLARRLEAAGIDVRRHGPQQVPPFVGYHLNLLRATRGAHVLHAHLHGALDLSMLGLLARTCRRVILTVHAHNVAGSVLVGHPLRAAAIGAALRSMAAVVCVNAAIVDEVVALGVRRDRTLLAPAFLPPDLDELLAEGPSPEVEAFLAAHDPVLCANAFTFDLMGGELLYGHDLLVDVLARLRTTRPGLGMVIHVSRVDDGGMARLEVLRERAARLGVGGHVLWVLGSRPFGPTLARAAAMLRPTLTDGDAVSVREALHAGVPVVASDVVGRPQGAFVAPPRDVDAWAQQTERALQQGPRVWSQPDPFPRLLALYNAVMSAPSM